MMETKLGTLKKKTFFGAHLESWVLLLPAKLRHDQETQQRQKKNIEIN